MNPYSESCAFVADDPEYVFVMLDKVRDVAVKIASMNLEMPSWREEIYPKDDNDFLKFLGVSTAICFCFWGRRKKYKKFDTEYPAGSGKIWYGSSAMDACLTRAFEEGLMKFDPDFLAGFTIEKARKIFIHKTTPLFMLSERVDCIRNIGEMMKNRQIDSFKDIFEFCEYEFSDIVSVLASHFNCFGSDIAEYRGRLIKFYKRAQLLPMMYHGRAVSSNGRLKPIADPENFGVPADYQLPKALRNFDILSYSPELSEIVDEGKLIKKGSPMEVEIRGQTTNVMMTLLEKINRIKHSKGLKPITMAELDYYLYKVAHNPEYQAIFHHRTLTTAY